MPPNRGLTPVRQPAPTPTPDPVMLAGALGATTFAAMLGGPLWAGFTLCGAGLFVYAHWQHQRQLMHTRMQQENLSHFLHGAGSPEDLAQIKGAVDIANQDLYAFLAAIKTEYGGESVRGSGRLPGEEQQEAVAPGITLTLAHDLGWWYAKLVFAGDTGRKFLNGEYTQWRARGRTPQEAIEAVLKKCGASRQQRMIQEYAAKLVNEGDR